MMLTTDDLCPLDPYWQREFAKGRVRCGVTDCTAPPTHICRRANVVGEFPAGAVEFRYLCAAHAAAVATAQEEAAARARVGGYVPTRPLDYAHPPRIRVARRARKEECS